MTANSRPLVVLGLCSFTHDSAAALVVGDQLIGMVEEERLTGVKHTKAYPGRSVDWLLAKAALTPADVDVVAYNFDGRRYLGAVPQAARLLLDPASRSAAIARTRGFAAVHSNFRERMTILRRRFPGAKVRPVLHHRAHGLYAFGASGYEDAAVLIIDSLGETQSTTIGHATRRGYGAAYRMLHAIHDPASLGYVYGAVTQHLGWRRGDEEGTVMALAALGDPARFRPLFRQAVQITSHGFRLDARLFPVRTLLSGAARVTPSFTAATCPSRRSDEEVLTVHADLAAALQERTEEVVLHLAARAQALTRSTRLCLGGGVAMNCVSVGKIVQAGLFEEVSVPPAPGDSGTAIGAAIAANLDIGGSSADGVAHTCYLGPDVSGTGMATRHPWDAADGDSRIFAGLDRQKLADPAQFVADRLAEGMIVGLARGPLEAGPRALGHRSILASPLLPGVVDRLNATVKFREPFRPFAPVVLADRAGDFFQLDQPSPFMSIAASVTDLALREIPAVVHANGTARVQTVTPELDPFLSEILQHFAARTGVPVLINTSLNIKGKPICGTLEMSLQCLRESGLDALLIGDGQWVTRAPALDPAADVTP